MLKPILVVSGEESQAPIVLCLIQYLALASFISKTGRTKTSSLSVSLMIYFTMIQYFYRTSHRERFSSIQFGKAFLGFSDYNYYLHGFLILVNTYSSHIIGFLMTPHILSEHSKKVEDSKTVNTNSSVSQVYFNILIINLNLLLCSTIMCVVTKRELMFP